MRHIVWAFSTCFFFFLCFTNDSYFIWILSIFWIDREGLVGQRQQKKPKQRIWHRLGVRCVLFLFHHVSFFYLGLFLCKTAHHLPELPTHPSLTWKVSWRGCPPFPYPPHPVPPSLAWMRDEGAFSISHHVQQWQKLAQMTVIRCLGHGYTYNTQLPTRLKQPAALTWHHNGSSRGCFFFHIPENSLGWTRQQIRMPQLGLLKT